MVRDDYYENGELLEGHCYSPEGNPLEYFPYITMPRFPGGKAALRKFIDRELKYPQEAQRMGIEGSVIVLFTVDENGSVKDPGIVNGDREFFNKEALRVVGRFPGWIPGEIDGIPSPLQISVPIEFKLFE
jgi:TonB family protein